MQTKEIDQNEIEKLEEEIQEKEKEKEKENQQNQEEKINKKITNESHLPEPIDYSVSLDHGPPFKYIGENPIEKDEEWETIESNDFISVSVGNVTHLSHDMISTPHAHWSDGNLDMSIIYPMKKTKLVRENKINFFFAEISINQSLIGFLIWKTRKRRACW